MYFVYIHYVESKNAFRTAKAFIFGRKRNPIKRRRVAPFTVLLSPLLLHNIKKLDVVWV